MPALEGRLGKGWAEAPREAGLQLLLLLPAPPPNLSGTLIPGPSLRNSKVITLLTPPIKNNQIKILCLHKIFDLGQWRETPVKFTGHGSLHSSACGPTSPKPHRWMACLLVPKSQSAYLFCPRPSEWMRSPLHDPTASSTAHLMVRIVYNCPCALQGETQGLPSVTLLCRSCSSVKICRKTRGFPGEQRLVPRRHIVLVNVVRTLEKKSVWGKKS